MLSTTLTEGLADYAIGDKVRALRLRKKMGLVELGKHAGLSPALLSKIERGRLFPTLPTLLRIALVFSVGLEYFFAGPREQPLVAIVRRADRLQFPAPAPGSAAYHFESLDFTANERRFNSYLAEFFPVELEQMPVHDHGGAEFIYVMSGALTIRIQATDYTLKTGDSIYFDSSAPHGYRRAGRTACQALVVTTT